MMHRCALVNTEQECTTWSCEDTEEKKLVLKYFRSPLHFPKNYDSVEVNQCPWCGYQIK